MEKTSETEHCGISIYVSAYTAKHYMLSHAVGDTAITHRITFWYTF